MTNILAPALAAFVAVAVRIQRPDAELVDLFGVGIIAAVLGYGWCRIVDWMFARGGVR